MGLTVGQKVKEKQCIQVPVQAEPSCCKEPHVMFACCQQKARCNYVASPFDTFGHHLGKAGHVLGEAGKLGAVAACVSQELLLAGAEVVGPAARL